MPQRNPCTPPPGGGDASRVRHFVNLTDGLEWAASLPAYAFVRVESTAIEHRDWDRILRDLDVNFLMCLALGFDCHFYDCGANRPTSKTVSVGVPFITDTLTRIWIRGDEFEARTPARQHLKRKLTYFKRFLVADAIRLTGHSRPTSRDGDKAYWRRLALAAGPGGAYNGE